MPSSMQRPHRRATRPIAVAPIVRGAIVAGLLFCTTGATCTRSIRSPFAPWSPPAPEVLVAGSSLDQVITAVNQNSARIQSIHTSAATIKVTGMPGIPALRGNIAAQRPGRVRLQASTALTGPEVDLGTNDQLFWFWVKRNEPPALYFARHDQFAGSAAQQFMPIEPQWLLEALGMVEFKPTDVHQGPVPLGDGKVEITSTVQSRIGVLTKRTVVDALRAWVLEQHVYDSAGKPLASAIARSHQYYEPLNVSLPRELDVKIPGSDLALNIDLGTLEVNTLSNSPQLWELPVIAGSPPHDLGSANAGGGSVPVIGHQLSQADWYAQSAIAGAPAPIAVAAAPSQLGRAPQFLSPGGNVPLSEAVAPNETGLAQRLPPGGIATQPFVAR